jgi:hypothetical protein
MLSKYAKAAALVAVGILTFVASALTDGLTDQEVVMTVSVGLSAIGVYVVPNLPVTIANVAKAVVTFLVTGMTALSLVILGGLTGTELIEVVLAAAASIGFVAGVGNKGDYLARQHAGVPAREI